MTGYHEEYEDQLNLPSHLIMHHTLKFLKTENIKGKCHISK